MSSYADHSWFEFRTLRPNGPAAVNIRWMSPCDVAIHLAICLEAFPLAAKPPFAVPGMLDRPYPDLSNWTQRKSGLREGLARLEDLLGELAIPVSFIVQADALAELDEFGGLLRNDRHSIVAGGAHAAALHSAFGERDAEARAVSDVLNRLREGIGVPIKAWRSPSGVHSRHTLDVIAAAGLRAILDINNDELPFEISTGAGSLLAVPWQHFSGDLHCLVVSKQPLDDYLYDLTQGIGWLRTESACAEPRIMTLPIHPWIMAVPHRFRAFAAALRNWASMPGVKFVNSDEIIAAAEPR